MCFLENCYFMICFVLQINGVKIVSNGQIREDVAKNQGNANRYDGPKKPPFTYTELIEHALSEKGQLTVSGIYQWIS